MVDIWCVSSAAAGGDGSAAKPFNTLSKLGTYLNSKYKVAGAAAGVRVIIRGRFPQQNLRIASMIGTAVAPWRIQGYEGDGQPPAIDGEGQWPADQSIRYNQWKDANGVVQGSYSMKRWTPILDFADGGSYFGQVDYLDVLNSGAGLVSGLNKISFTRCRFIGCLAVPVRVKTSGSDVWFDQCEIRQYGLANNKGMCFASWPGGVILAGDNGAQFPATATLNLFQRGKITRCIISDGWGEGINMFASVGNIVEDTIISDTFSPLLYFSGGQDFLINRVFGYRNPASAVNSYPEKTLVTKADLIPYGFNPGFFTFVSEPPAGGTAVSGPYTGQAGGFGGFTGGTEFPQVPAGRNGRITNCGLYRAGISEFRPKGSFTDAEWTANPESLQHFGLVIEGNTIWANGACITLQKVIDHSGGKLINNVMGQLSQSGRPFFYTGQWERKGNLWRYDPGGGYVTALDRVGDPKFSGAGDPVKGDAKYFLPLAGSLCVEGGVANSDLLVDYVGTIRSTTKPTIGMWEVKTAVPVPPTVTGLSPAEVVNEGVRLVAVTGTGFIGVSKVEVGGVSVSFSVTGETAMVISVPANMAAGTWDVLVTATAGRNGFSDAKLVVTDAPELPVVVGVSPAGGLNNGATAIVITGTGFSGVLGATVGGVALTGRMVISSTEIRGSVPAGLVAGVAPVVVTTTAGISNSSVGFVVSEPAHLPVISGISPGGCQEGVGAVVTISGSYLAGVLEAMLGATSLQVLSSGDSVAVVGVPSTVVAGSYLLAVRTSAGTSNSVGFVVDEAVVVPPPVRISQFGRMVFVGSSREIRVSQAGRMVLVSGTSKMDVTQFGRMVLGKSSALDVSQAGRMVLVYAGPYEAVTQIARLSISRLKVEEGPAKLRTVVFRWKPKTSSMEHGVAATKEPNEKVVLLFDFREGVGVQDEVVGIDRVWVKKGADDASNLPVALEKAGKPYLDDGCVYQTVIGGVSGVRYTVVCRVNLKSGVVLTVKGILWVRDF